MYHKIKTYWPVQVHLSHKYSNQVNTLIRHIQLWELIKRISAQTCHVNKNSRLSALRANRVDTHIRHVQLYPLIFFMIQKFSIKTCWTNCAIHIYLKAPTINGLHIGGKKLINYKHVIKSMLFFSFSEFNHNLFPVQLKTLCDNFGKHHPVCFKDVK